MRMSADTRRWLTRTAVQAAVVLAVGAALIALVGVAQRAGWIRPGGGGVAPVAAAAADTRWICPMMCVPPSSEPGKCPVCAMDLVPATSGGGPGDGKSVSFDPAARRLAGIETVPVAAMPAAETLTAVGELTVDQSREATLSAYVAGRLEKLYADSVGVRVEKGQKLVELYSPDLYTAQQEYLAALRNAASGPLAGDTLTGELVGIAREKLVELGLSAAQIDAVRDAGRAAPRITVPAPIAGTVTHKPLNEGDYVAVGQPVYHIADLSAVWLRLELFPEQAARVREGQPVTAKVDSLPGRTFAGRVLLVEPTVDMQTRTVGVRVELPNPDGLLRPGDYATAKLELPVVPGDVGPSAGGSLVSVPSDAVLRAGGGSVVYVETEPGRFEIRTVALGPSIGESVVVTDGLSEGESVALRGNFLIDSQMQLAGNPSLLDTSKLNAVTEPGEPVFPDGPLPLDGTPTLIAGEKGEQLDRVFAAYFAVRDRLASDAMPEADDAMTLLTDTAAAAADESLPEVARRHLKVTSEAAAALFEEDIDVVRDGFRRVSRGLLPVASRVRGPQTAATLTHFYCPMVEGGGGDWLQVGSLDRDALRNPYWGSQMLTCGRKVRELTAASVDSPSDEKSRSNRGADPGDAGRLEKKVLHFRPPRKAFEERLGDPLRSIESQVAAVNCKDRVIAFDGASPQVKRVHHAATVHCERNGKRHVFRHTELVHHLTYAERTFDLQELKQTIARLADCTLRPLEESSQLRRKRRSGIDPPGFNIVAAPAEHRSQTSGRIPSTRGAVMYLVEESRPVNFTVVESITQSSCPRDVAIPAAHEARSC